MVDPIPTLQTAIGPVILISGVALLLLTMTNRLGRAIDRARLIGPPWAGLIRRRALPSKPSCTSCGAARASSAPPLRWPRSVPCWRQRWSSPCSSRPCSRCSSRESSPGSSSPACFPSFLPLGSSCTTSINRWRRSGWRCNRMGSTTCDGGGRGRSSAAMEPFARRARSRSTSLATPQPTRVAAIGKA